MRLSFLNIANIITLSRVLALFLIVLLLHMDFLGAYTLAFLAFVVAALSDVLDGYIARRFGMVSVFGKFMDALTDKILVIGLLVVLLVIGLLPHWTLLGVLFIICREFLVTGLRLLAAGQGRVLAAETAGKQKTFLQLYTIGNTLFYGMLSRDWIAYTSPGFEALAYKSACIAFVVATVLTAYSGARYLYRYWDIFLEK